MGFLEDMGIIVGGSILIGIVTFIGTIALIWVVSN